MEDKLNKIQTLVDISNDFKEDYPDISDMLKMISELLLNKIEQKVFTNREQPDENSDDISNQILGS